MHTCCLHRAQVTQLRLLEAQASVPEPSRLSLVVPPEALRGSPRERLADVPLYAHIKVCSPGCFFKLPACTQT